ncbi:MAG: TIGR02449 family protein [Gammaproteobacteria bacterium]|nr:TIGR02449 family protein [Gammaproteobacteria bacterium]
MTTSDSNSSYLEEFKRLESRLDALLERCKRLEEENRSLRENQETLVAERASLLHKNEQARSRVEGMINRLRALEHSV